MTPFKIAIAALAALLLLMLPAGAHAATGWRWPVAGRVIAPYRNGDDPYAAGQHRGIDIAAPAGTPVLAAVGGTVSFAGALGSSGLTVAVRTPDGGLETTYLHLSSAAVRAGQSVGAGDRIGAVGTSGSRSAAEPHLHFGVRDAADRHGYHDPLDYLPPLPAPEPGRPGPRSAPVPVPLPAPRLAAPALVPLARGASAASGAPLPGRAHARHLASRPAFGLPVAAGHPMHLPRPTAGSSGAAAAHGAPGRAAEPAPDARPNLQLVPGLGPARPGEAASPSRRARAAGGPAKHSGGVDAGWLAACVGLVAAATLLGRPAGPRQALRRTGQRVSPLIRPLRGGG